MINVISRPEKPKKYVTSASGKAVPQFTIKSSHAPKELTPKESVIMKIQFKSPHLSVAFGLLLTMVVPGECFYNPNTGRWLSRDPIEEEGGPNLLGLNSNDLISTIDPSGLKVLVVSVGRDWTLRGPVDGVYDKYVKERNPVMQKGLQEVVGRCTACTSIEAKVRLGYDSNPKLILPVPGDLRNKKRTQWDVDSESDLKLMFKDYDTLSEKKEAVPMFWTLESLSASKDRPAGVGFQGKGITLSYTGSQHFPHLLAHELGHYVGLGHAPDTDVKNVMNRLYDGTDPDAEYCKKVLELFK